ncbi:acyl-CoA carboxylase epsilon subunit [Streptomyces sp. TRM70308]|uniref:acyl-CoA carboxylase epsilon subunit n=1 Tax=Streptomyces sp. TRM70308 TaxID=3131932 RepID=UPI003D0821AB
MSGREALAAASIRVTRGNPTAEEVAALAALLCGLGAAAAPGARPPAPRPRPVRHPAPAAFTPPGAWAC